MPHCFLFFSLNRIRLQRPFSLAQWLVEHADELASGRRLPLFGEQYQSEIYVYGASSTTHRIEANQRAETMLWQVESGQSKLVIDDGSTSSRVELESDTTHLVVKGSAVDLTVESGHVISIRMDPARHDAFFERL